MTYNILKSQVLIDIEYRFFIVLLTSLHPLMVNSLNGLISSMRRFIRRNLSLNPTKTYKPDGWSAILYASSWNTLYNSSVLRYKKMNKKQWYFPFYKPIMILYLLSICKCVARQIFMFSRFSYLNCFKYEGIHLGNRFL